MSDNTLPGIWRLISSIPYKVVTKAADTLSPFVRGAMVKLNITRRFSLHGFSIELPADHMLPFYKQRHGLYDRFLPYLSKYLEPGDTVIDVGANCGDTFAAMYDANRKLRFVCIEPDPQFYAFLYRNTEAIRSFDPDVAVTLVQSLVGRQVTNVSLEGVGGTKKAVAATPGGGTTSRTLDSIVSGGLNGKVCLLKTDVDGFDFDVLDSASQTIDAHHPILYFECLLDESSQKKGYEDTIGRLFAEGYRDWLVFDNYGELVVRTDDLSVLTQLLGYVWRQNIGRSARTIRYFDILAATTDDAELISKVTEGYLTIGLNP